MIMKFLLRECWSSDWTLSMSIVQTFLIKNVNSISCIIILVRTYCSTHTHCCVTQSSVCARIYLFYSVYSLSVSNNLQHHLSQAFPATRDYWHCLLFWIFAKHMHASKSQVEWKSFFFFRFLIISFINSILFVYWVFKKGWDLGFT